MSFLAAVAYIWFTGIVLSILAAKVLRYRYSRLELVSLSFLFGAIAVASVLLIYSIAGIKYNAVSIMMFISGFSVCSVLLFIFFPPRNIFIGYSERRKSYALAEKLIMVGIMIQVLWVLFIALSAPVHSHDAVATYALKAKIFFQEGGIPAGFFTWSESTVSHPDYPIMLPLFMTWIYEFTGFNDLIVTFAMPILYMVLLALFYSLSRRFFSRIYSLFAVFLLSTIPQVADYATIIHADLLLAVFVSAGFIYMVHYLSTKEKAPLIIASILFGSATWIKNEGMVFAAVFIFTMLIFSLKSEKDRGPGTLMMSIIPLAIISLPWFLVKFTSGTVNSDIDISMIGVSTIWENMKDIPVLLDLFQQEVFGPKKWNIFWVLFFTVLVWKRKDLWKGDIFYMTVFLLASMAGYFTGYMSTTGANLYFYVNMTISRFMLHFTGICMFYTMYLAWPGLKGSFEGDKDGR